MKSLLIKKSNTGIMATEIITAIVVVAAVYGSYLYVPLVYKTEELQTLVKDYTFKSGQATEAMIQAAVVEDAKTKLDIHLNVDDVIVEKGNGRTKITAKWNTTIDLPFDYQIPRTFTVSFDRKSMF